MVEVTIDNEAISVTLDNETTTVPDGEVWKVTLAVRLGSSDYKLSLNGETFAASSYDFHSFETVLTGGDEIQGRGHIGGFKV